MFESLVYDPARKQFLVGSVREGKIYRVSKDGKLEDFIAPRADNGLWSVYAMAADPASDALYVASTSSVYFKGFKQEDFGQRRRLQVQAFDRQAAQQVSARARQPAAHAVQHRDRQARRSLCRRWTAQHHLPARRRLVEADGRESEADQHPRARGQRRRQAALFRRLFARRVRRRSRRRKGVRSRLRRRQARARRHRRPLRV